MVRLKVLLSLICSTRALDFNSNMVRLKEPVEEKKPCGCGFQFQYGAIKSQPFVVAINVDAEFQFQYGAIKRHFQNFMTN